MSTATTSTTSRPQQLCAPSLARLTRVELRKSLDTRASRWFVAGLALLTVAGAVYSLANADIATIKATQTFATPWEIVRMLLPVLGVLSMTSEWSQHTALTTFTLVPRRGRVLAAKLGALLAVALAAVMLTAAVAVIAAAAAGPLTASPVHWEGLLRSVVGALLGGVCLMGMGAAIGALLQQTAPALVAYFVAPTLVTVAGTALLDDRAEWFAPTVAIRRVSELDLSGAVAPTIVALLLWVVLPLAAGTVRWLRREVP